MNLSGAKVVIVGMGRSGLSAARLCLSEGARVTLNDSRTLEHLPADVRTLPAEAEFGGHELDFTRFDLVVLSPGVPPIPKVEAAAEAGTAVIGELELASRFVTAPIIAVGGTNGKSTTTALTGHLLGTGGKRTFMGGNFGAPASEAVGQEWDFIVLEVSSFQLERAPTFKPWVSVLLNITPDHLDRYESFEAYAAAKGNAFAQQDSEDYAIIPGGDERCEAEARRGHARRLTVASEGRTGAEGADAVASRERVVVSGTEFTLPQALRGGHLCMNAASAILAAQLSGVSEESLRTGLESFTGLPHRTQYVGSVDGVSFYDDSKATNVSAAVAALLGLAHEGVVLIAGGRDKGGSYAPLVEALAERGRGVVLIGEAADLIERSLDGALPVIRAASMDDAVFFARRFARSGDAVLLSPACSSFDMFESYAERGRVFQKATKRMGVRPPVASIVRPL